MDWMRHVKRMGWGLIAIIGSILGFLIFVWIITSFPGTVALVALLGLSWVVGNEIVFIRHFRQNDRD